MNLSDFNAIPRTDYRFDRRYAGSLQAVIFDWAGTTFDFGSMAPIHALQNLFEASNVPITLAEAREPMGVEKREHIQSLLMMPRIAERWQRTYGEKASAADIDRLYQDFIPLQIKAISASADPVPGLVETMTFLQNRGIAIGTNTGYSRDMLRPLLKRAAVHGFKPASNVCATDVPRGRPFPHMSLRNMIELQVSDVSACVKVDDTLSGIEEGLAAGMWTVGVAVSGNEVGLPLSDWQVLSESEQQHLRTMAYNRFYRTGAHFVIDTVKDLPKIVDIIEQKLLGNS